MVQKVIKIKCYQHIKDFMSILSFMYKFGLSNLRLGSAREEFAQLPKDRANAIIFKLISFQKAYRGPSCLALINIINEVAEFIQTASTGAKFIYRGKAI